jgi:hypothetical protein
MRARTRQAGFIDTDMGAVLSSGSKTHPSEVARKTVEGILSGLDHVMADERAEKYGGPAGKIRRACTPRCRPAGTSSTPKVLRDERA